MPLKNQTIHILNSNLEDCPIGVRGEICIGGDGVAMCYFGDDEKTQVSFVNHSKYGRIYKTGDYGKMHKEGFVEFLGRMDSQVKIRGYRIELCEIENCAMECGVKKAVAVVKTLGGSEGIVLYIENAENVDEETIKYYLRAKLPDYMTPALIERIDKIPVTANGKVDRKRLKNMKDGVILANAGHFDCEVNVARLREISVSAKEMRANVTGYEQKDGRILNVIAEGRLVNLASGDGHPAEIMDMSFALQFLALKYIAEQGDKLKVGINNLPYELDYGVAIKKLEAMGGAVDILTEEQRKYLYGE